jgi:hypothetical protein
MIRGLLVAASIAVAAIGVAASVESTGFGTSPVTFTASCLSGDPAPLDVHCTPPTQLPKDTYKCNDGCFSNSQTPQGACSHHGGIEETLTPTGNG